MKPFELTFLVLEPFWLPLHRRIRKQLRDIARQSRERPEILDVGGRRSHYTIGVPANITITDLPQETDTQKQLNLGLDESIVRLTRSRRSNIRTILYDDMSRSQLPNASYDCVVAVEVLEHVDEDAKFVANVRRVLKPGGVFVMTTPNGDFRENTNPDHRRHYRRDELRRLLESEFEDVRVQYAIRGGKYRSLGLRPWSVRRPLETLRSMAGNMINAVQSGSEKLSDQAQGTCHLVATARAASPGESPHTS